MHLLFHLACFLAGIILTDRIIAVVQVRRSHRKMERERAEILDTTEKDYYECLDLIYDGHPPLNEIDQKRSDALLGRTKPVALPDPYNVPGHPRDMGAQYEEVKRRWVQHPIVEPTVKKFHGLFTEYDVGNKKAYCMDCDQWVSFNELAGHFHQRSESEM